MFALKPEWKQYEIRQRLQGKLAWFNFINPAFSTQALLKLAAGVELNSFIDFRMQVSNCHSKE